jgi:para-nitrobenzyl esterase
MALARIMLSFWSNFAATGDPNGAALPEWPRYEAPSPRIGFLAGGGAEEISAETYAQEHHCALWDALARERAR